MGHADDSTRLQDNQRCVHCTQQWTNMKRGNQIIWFFSADVPVLVGKVSLLSSDRPHGVFSEVKVRVWRTF